MIRVLVIGADASSWTTRLRAAAPGAEFEAARLPAASIRAFERSPADVVLLCGDAVARPRLAEVLSALRERPIGRLVPCVWVGEGELEAADTNVAAQTSATALADLVAELVGVDLGELPIAAPIEVPADTGPLREAAIKRKLQHVRHETYFDVLEVSSDATRDELREAFISLRERFGEEQLSLELRQRFAEELAELRDGLEDAFAVLGDEQLRAAYTDARR